MELYFGIAVVFLIGVCAWIDAARLAKHVQVAETLMADGMHEDQAMELSGCNFWDKPWYARLFATYPALPKRR